MPNISNYPANKTIVSTGMICLDIIERENGYWLMAGGSAINPLIILNQWGWDVYPTGRIGNDASSQAIVQDCSHFNIQTKFIFQDDTVQTPVYMMTTNQTRHTYHKKCIICGITLPNFTPLTLSQTDEVITHLPSRVDVCLIERLSEPAMRLVKECKQRGAWVMFEPNRIEDESQLNEMLAVTDIVKYSTERIPLLCGIKQHIQNHAVKLVMQTMGNDGIRYRILFPNKLDWCFMPSILSKPFADAAGAGDWTTARFLHELMNTDHVDNQFVDNSKLLTLINKAQIEASQNCTYPAPRSRMYLNLLIMNKGICSYHQNDLCEYLFI